MAQNNPTSFKLNIQSETGKLHSVVLGIAQDSGEMDSVEECYDPKSKYFLNKNQFPLEIDCISEMEKVAKILEKHGVQVFRPENIPGVNQIFSRDISFVIENRFFRTNIIEDRAEEVKGIQFLTDQIPNSNFIQVPPDCRIEGGDVIVHGTHLFVGYSEEPDFSTYKVARTNRAGVEFLREQFPEKTIHAFELVKSDEDPFADALHLDCCFQPFGETFALLYPGGFKNHTDVEFLTNFFGKENIVEISQQEMFDMGCNVFSISPQTLISAQHLTRINAEIRHKGIQVEETPYYEVAKMGGMFRCSTLPLNRD
jgi:N-dimethylarginine dimethylaminohydrolase